MLLAELSTSNAVKGVRGMLFLNTTTWLFHNMPRYHTGLIPVC